MQKLEHIQRLIYIYNNLFICILFKNIIIKIKYNFQMMEDIPNHEDLPSKRNVSLNTNAFKNVARCGICLQWFSDHTTMLTHLRTHSDNYTCKNFTCHICKKSFKEKWQLFRHEVYIYHF